MSPVGFSNPTRLIVYPFDQRPIKVIDFLSTENATGLVSEWTNEATAYSWLTGKIDVAFAQGYRRFFFNLPAGDRPFQSFSTASIWEPLTSWQKTLLSGSLRNYIAIKKNDGAVFGIIAGFYIDDVTTTHVQNPRLLQFSEREDILFMKRNWTNWISIGISNFVGINADQSSAFAILSQLTNVFWSRGVRVYGKNLPYALDNSIDYNRLVRAGWMAPWSQLRAIEADYGQQNIADYHAETIIELHLNNAIAGEITFAFSYNDALTLLNKGYVLASWDNATNADLIIMQAYQAFISPNIPQGPGGEN